MSKSSIGAALLVVPFFTGIILSHPDAVQGAGADTPATWSRASATRFLDARETWWQAWPRAQKDNGTVCISCHTQLPYALIRPTLRHELNEPTISAPEQAMLASVEKRITNWSTVAPFYSDAVHGPGKTVEARNAEAVLNAIILSSFDARLGHLRPVTLTAFNNVWALQEPSGSWTWQNFHLGPWEGNESGYQTSALLVLATHQAPDNYATRPEVRAHLTALTHYLQQNYATQPLLNRLYVLWASSFDPKLLSPSQRASLVTAILSKQQPDGGWNTSTLDPYERKDNSPAPTASDGYATALVALALKHTPNARKPLQQSLQWLRSHQNADGTWTAESINKHRNPDTDPALFMTDAATAYAVLALDQSD